MKREGGRGMATHTQLKQVKRALQHELDTLAGRLSKESETETIQELSPYDNHPADLGSETFAREVDVGLRFRLQQRLDDLDRAEAKLDEGTYGICDRCHRPIPIQRLKAIPEAIYCVECQRMVETPYVPPPSETKVTPMPFGVIPPKSAVEVDGEDTWQSLADWGTSNSPQDVPPAIGYHQTFVDFQEPDSFVETVETLIDEQGEVLFDTARKRPMREARRNEKESDEY